MKIIKALKLDKYDDCARYTQYEGFIYKDVTGGFGARRGITSEPVYCVTLYAELEDGEDTQYPLEDILEEYCVVCAEATEEKEEAGKRIYIIEVEGEDVDSIKAIAGFVGKRVYNYEEGDYVMLGIE